MPYQRAWRFACSSSTCIRSTNGRSRQRCDLGFLMSMSRCRTRSWPSSVNSNVSPPRWPTPTSDLDSPPTSRISLAAASEILEVGGESRSEVGVGHRGGETFEFTELGQDLVRHRDMDMRKPRSHRCRDRPFVLRMQVDEEQANRHALWYGILELLQCSLQVGFAERLDDSVWSATFGYREPEIAWHERWWPAGGQVVEGETVLTADLDHVAEPLSGDERGAYAFSLEQGVGRDGRAVRERLDVRLVHAEVLDPGKHPLGLLGSAGHLRGNDAPIDHADDVGKR